MVKRLDKIPRSRKVTMDEILDSDTVSQVMSQVSAHIGEIDDIVIVWTAKGESHFNYNVELPQFLAMLEVAKFDAIHDSRHEENDY